MRCCARPLFGKTSFFVFRLENQSRDNEKNHDNYARTARSIHKKNGKETPSGKPFLLNKTLNKRTYKCQICAKNGPYAEPTHKSNTTEHKSDDKTHFIATERMKKQIVNKTPQGSTMTRKRDQPTHDAKQKLRHNNAYRNQKERIPNKISENTERKNRETSEKGKIIIVSPNTRKLRQNTQNYYKKPGNYMSKKYRKPITVPYSNNVKSFRLMKRRSIGKSKAHRLAAACSSSADPANKTENQANSFKTQGYDQTKITTESDFQDKMVIPRNVFDRTREEIHGLSQRKRQDQLTQPRQPFKTATFFQQTGIEKGQNSNTRNQGKLNHTNECKTNTKIQGPSYARVASGPPRPNPRFNRIVATDTTWIPPFEDDAFEEGMDERSIEVPERITHRMKDKNGKTTEGTIYISRTVESPQSEAQTVEVHYGFFETDFKLQQGVHFFTLTRPLPPTIKFRQPLKGQNLLSYSVQMHSPNIKFEEVLKHKIPLPKDLLGLRDWEGFWADPLLFVDLYGNAAENMDGTPVFPKLIVPDSPLWPMDLRGSPWSNSILMHCTKSALGNALKKLNLHINKGYELKIWFYKKEDPHNIQTWSSYEGEKDANNMDPNDDSVVCALETRDNWSLILLYYFAFPLFSKAEPAKRWRNNREFLSTLIHVRVEEGSAETEFQPYAEPRTIQEIRCKLIGAFSLSCIYTADSSVLRRKVIDPEIDPNYASYWENYQYFAEAFDNNFMPIRQASYKVSKLHALLANPNSIWKNPEKPETMQEAMIKSLKDYEEFVNNDRYGHENASMRAVIHYGKVQRENEINRQVEMQSSPEFLEKLGEKTNYVEAKKAEQLSILCSEEAKKALKVTELEKTIIALSEDKEQLELKLKAEQTRIEKNENALEEMKNEFARIREELNNRIAEPDSEANTEDAPAEGEPSGRKRKLRDTTVRAPRSSATGPKSLSVRPVVTGVSPPVRVSPCWRTRPPDLTTPNIPIVARITQTPRNLNTSNKTNADIRNKNTPVQVQAIDLTYTSPDNLMGQMRSKSSTSINFKTEIYAHNPRSISQHHRSGNCTPPLTGYATEDPDSTESFIQLQKSKKLKPRTGTNNELASITLSTDDDDFMEASTEDITIHDLELPTYSPTDTKIHETAAYGSLPKPKTSKTKSEIQYTEDACTRKRKYEQALEAIKGVTPRNKKQKIQNKQEESKTQLLPTIQEIIDKNRKKIETNTNRKALITKESNSKEQGINMNTNIKREGGKNETAELRSILKQKKTPKVKQGNTEPMSDTKTKEQKAKTRHSTDKTETKSSSIEDRSLENTKARAEERLKKKIKDMKEMRKKYRYNPNKQKSELTRINREVLECPEPVLQNDVLGKDAERPVQSNKRTKYVIEADTKFILKQKQHEKDERSRMQFIMDLEKYQELNKIDASGLKKGRKQCADAWKLYRTENPDVEIGSKTELRAERMRLLGGTQSAWDYALGYEHEDIPRTRAEIKNCLEKSEKHKKELNAWFNRKENKNLQYGKKMYLTGIFAGASGGKALIENVLSHTNNPLVIQYGIDTKEKIEELERLREQLNKLAEFTSNPKRIGSLWLSFSNLLNLLIPLPGSLEIARIVIENFSPKTDASKFPVTGQPKTILKTLLQRQGIETLEFKEGAEQIRAIKSINKDCPLEKMPILAATRTSTTNATTNRSENLITETILMIICLNTNFSPEEINFNNLNNVWKNKKGSIILNELAKINAYHPEKLDFLLNPDFHNEHFSNIIKEHEPAAKNDSTDSDAEKRQVNLQKLDVIEGRIPHGPLHPTERIPSPHLMIKDANNGRNRAINDIKSKLGNRNKSQNSKPKKENKFKKLIQNLQDCPQDYKAFKQLATTSGITNPSDAEIEKLFSTARKMNAEEIEQESHLDIISTNPGKICTNTCRTLVDYAPNADIYALNELQIQKFGLKDQANWPPNHTIIANDSSPDGMIYTAIMIKDYLKPFLTVIQSPGNTTSIDIRVGKNKIKRFVCTYRHNNREQDVCYYYKNYKRDKFLFLDWIREIVRQAKRDKVDLFLMGDWNVELHGRRPEDNRALIDGLNHAVRNLTNLITSSTNFRKNQRASQIDVFFVSRPEKMKIRSMQLNKPPMSFDGHCGHSVRTPLERPLEQFEVKVAKITDREKLFQHMTINYDKYQERLNSKPNNSEKIEESYNILNESIAACSHSVGKIKKTGNKNIKPTPIDTIQYRQAARTLYDEIEKKEAQPNFEKTILHCLKVNLIKITVMCKKLGARDSKNRTNVIMGKLENANAKDFWEVANALLEVPPVRELVNTVEEHMDEVMTLQTNTITDPENYKGHTFTARHNTKLDNFRASLHGNKFTPSVLKCYRKLKGHTKGHTGVSRNLIDSLPIGTFRMIVLTPILSAIQEGTYPKCWRTNRTTILPKKTGIRPLSISEVFSTILEKLIIGQINDFLENNELLHTTQNGFRAGLSTASSLATVINYIAEKRAQGNYVIVSALDAKNAFGSPPHKSLVKCLENVFAGKALKLLSESLGRNAVVASNGIFSSHRQLADLGVPQGSVISPSIFCLYASELRNALDPTDGNTHCSIFADDCILLSCGKTVQDAVKKTEEIFNLVGEKMKSIGMVQVPEKTAVIITGMEGCHIKDISKYPKKINCNGTEVKISSHFTYLGTELGEVNHKLSYSFNTEKLITKMLQMTNRTRSLAGYIKDRDLQSVQRAISLGSYCHNSETTAKWPAKDHERAQNTHIRGLRSKYKPWFLRKYEDFDAASTERKIETLKNSGQPTLFEAKLSKFYGLLNKTIRLSKATSLLKEITRGVWIINTKTERQIMPLFNLYHTDRELHKERYFKREFNLTTNIQTREFRAAHHFSNIIKVLLARDIITLKIIQPKEISSEAARIMWPYTLMHDYNTLPSFIRGNVISRDQKKLITSYLKGNHKHLKQNLKCQDCITGKTNNLPYNVTNLKRNILDDECTTEIKIQAEKETELMTDELTCTLITDTASTILSETNTGSEIESMWETELDDSDICPDEALQKLLAICIAYGAGPLLHSFK
ncbi:unnamed protein product [Oikopleura dioica]|uniref:Reverse transcriptase domain-containing protein n=1 Tax=Oikopleura dioica TaxID=34765 RepID=E4X3X3_OIKDI|nr:unnamed protein product [Oikopleura dioica]